MKRQNMRGSTRAFLTIAIVMMCVWATTGQRGEKSGRDSFQPMDQGGTSYCGYIAFSRVVSGMLHRQYNFNAVFGDMRHDYGADLEAIFGGADRLKEVPEKERKKEKKGGNELQKYPFLKKEHLKRGILKKLENSRWKPAHKLWKESDDDSALVEVLNECGYGPRATIEDRPDTWEELFGNVVSGWIPIRDSAHRDVPDGHFVFLEIGDIEQFRTFGSLKREVEGQEEEFDTNQAVVWVKIDNHALLGYGVGESDNPNSTRSRQEPYIRCMNSWSRHHAVHVFRDYTAYGDYTGRGGEWQMENPVRNSEPNEWEVTGSTVKVSLDKERSGQLTVRSLKEVQFFEENGELSRSDVGGMEELKKELQMVREKLEELKVAEENEKKATEAVEKKRKRKERAKYTLKEAEEKSRKAGGKVASLQKKVEKGDAKEYVYKLRDDARRREEEFKNEEKEAGGSFIQARNAWELAVKAADAANAKIRELRAGNWWTREEDLEKWLPLREEEEKLAQERTLAVKEHAEKVAEKKLRAKNIGRK